MRDKFRNKNGDLTHYAMACGYQQIFNIRENMYLQLYHDGGSVFHVRLFDHNDSKSVRVFWHTFDTLTGARNYWHQTKKNLLELSKS